MTVARRLMTALAATAVMATGATAVTAQSDGADILCRRRQRGRPVLVDRQAWGGRRRQGGWRPMGGSVTWLGPLNYDNLGPDARRT